LQRLKQSMSTRFARLFSASVPALLILLGYGHRVEGAVVNVSVIDYAFVPARTNINANDTVIWTWPTGSDEHNVSSDSSPAAWPVSAILNGPATFTNTFTTAGTFPYECTVHGFTGTIVVAASSAPPTVAITAPASGAVYAAPANVTIQATASDGGNAITNVAFKIGGIVLSNVRTAPYSASIDQLEAGSYTLSAVASANNGLKATNSVSISIVAPVAVSLANATMASGVFQFSYPATIGLSYVVQRSSDLISWITLVTNTAATTPLIFVDSQATNNSAFYRIGLAPNP
jgi:plastocyanin